MVNDLVFGSWRAVSGHGPAPAIHTNPLDQKQHRRWITCVGDGPDRAVTAEDIAAGHEQRSGICRAVCGHITTPNSVGLTTRLTLRRVALPRE